MKQCVRRGWAAHEKTRQELRRRWPTLDERTRQEISRALVFTEAVLQRGWCRAAAQHLGFARYVLKRGTVRTRWPQNRIPRTGLTQQFEHGIRRARGS